MGEALLVMGMVLALAMTSLVYRYVAWLDLLRGGATLILVGLLLSIMGGGVYHVMLYRALQPRGALPRGWYWNPTALHTALERRERGVVLPWFYLGASAFGLVMLGCIALLMTALRSP